MKHTFKVNYYDHNFNDYTLHIRAKTMEEAIDKLYRTYNVYGVWSFEQVNKNK